MADADTATKDKPASTSDEEEKRLIASRYAPPIQSPPRGQVVGQPQSSNGSNAAPSPTPAQSAQPQDSGSPTPMSVQLGRPQVQPQPPPAPTPTQAQPQVQDSGSPTPMSAQLGRPQAQPSPPPAPAPSPEGAALQQAGQYAGGEVRTLENQGEFPTGQPQPDQGSGSPTPIAAQLGGQPGQQPQQPATGTASDQANNNKNISFENWRFPVDDSAAQGWFLPPTDGPYTVEQLKNLPTPDLEKYLLYHSDIDSKTATAILQQRWQDDGTKPSSQPGFQLANDISKTLTNLANATGLNPKQPGTISGGQVAPSWKDYVQGFLQNLGKAGNTVFQAIGGQPTDASRIDLKRQLDNHTLTPAQYNQQIGYLDQIDQIHAGRAAKGFGGGLGDQATFLQQLAQEQQETTRLYLQANPQFAQSQMAKALQESLTGAELGTQQIAKVASALDPANYNISKYFTGHNAMAYAAPDAVEGWLNKERLFNVQRQEHAQGGVDNWTQAISNWTVTNAKRLGIGPEYAQFKDPIQLAKEGRPIDPENISAVSDLTQMIESSLIDASPELIGLPSFSKIAGHVASDVGLRGAGWAASTVAPKVAGALQTVWKSDFGKVVQFAAGMYELLHGDPSKIFEDSAKDAAVYGALYATKKYGGLAGEMLDRAADNNYRGGGFLAQGLSRGIRTTSDAISHSFPYALLNSGGDPGQFWNNLTQLSAFHGVLGLPGWAKGTLAGGTGDYLWAKDGDVIPVPPKEYSSGIGDARTDLDKVNLHLINGLDDDTKNEVTRTQHAAFDHTEVYLTTPQILHNDLQQRFGATALQKPWGIFVYPDRTGTGKAAAFIDVNHIGEAMPHEAMGHGLDALMSQTARDQIGDSVIKYNDPDKFIRDNYGQNVSYASLPDNPPPSNPNALSKNQIKMEMRVEEIARYWNSGAMDQFYDEKPGMARALRYGLGDVLDHWGIPSQTFRSTSSMGINPSFGNSFLIDGYYRDLINHHLTRNIDPNWPTEFPQRGETYLDTTARRQAQLAQQRGGGGGPPPPPPPPPPPGGGTGGTTGGGATGGGTTTGGTTTGGGTPGATGTTTGTGTTTTAPGTPTTPTTPAAPTQQQIQVRAHQIFQQRQAAGLAGDEASDWAQAERELTTGAKPGPPPAPGTPTTPSPQTIAKGPTEPTTPSPETIAKPRPGDVTKFVGGGFGVIAPDGTLKRFLSEPDARAYADKVKAPPTEPTTPSPETIAKEPAETKAPSKFETLPEGTATKPGQVAHFTDVDGNHIFAAPSVEHGGKIFDTYFKDEAAAHAFANRVNTPTENLPYVTKRAEDGYLFVTKADGSTQGFRPFYESMVRKISAETEAALSPETIAKAPTEPTTPSPQTAARTDLDQTSQAQREQIEESINKGTPHGEAQATAENRPQQTLEQTGEEGPSGVAYMRGVRKVVAPEPERGAIRAGFKAYQPPLSQQQLDQGPELIGSYGKGPPAAPGKTAAQPTVTQPKAAVATTATTTTEQKPKLIPLGEELPEEKPEEKPAVTEQKPKLVPLPKQEPAATEQQPTKGQPAKTTAEQTAETKGKVVGVVGSEFGEVDRPSRGGYTEPGWNKGAWGDSLEGKDNEGVALPPSILRHLGYTGQKGYGQIFNSNYVVRIHNPKTGATTETSLKDLGPGSGTGALIDMLYGTRAKLGFAENFKGGVTFEIVNKKDGKVAYAPTGHEIAEGGGGGKGGGGKGKGGEGGDGLLGAGGGGGTTPFTSGQGPAVPEPARGGIEEAERTGGATYTAGGGGGGETATSPGYYGGGGYGYGGYGGGGGGGFAGEPPAAPGGGAVYAGGGGVSAGGGGGGVAYMPGRRKQMGGITPEGEEGAPAETSTLGQANVPGFEQLGPHLAKNTTEGTRAAQKLHAGMLSPDDTRVKKQADNMFKGEHFVPGDPLHTQVLGNTPLHERMALTAGQAAIANKQPMHMTYASAPPPEAKESPITRQSREVNYAASSPQARLLGQTNARLAGHSIIPTSVGVSLGKKKGDPNSGYIQGISTTVAAHNHYQLNKALGQMGEESPYPKLDMRFRQDLGGYIQNLLAGHRGTGNKYAPGTEEHPSNPDRNYVPYRLHQKEADFLNAVINNQSARHDKGLQELARKGGTLLNDEGETNPVRHAIDASQAGVHPGAPEEIKNAAIKAAAKDRWSNKILEPTIRSFNTGLIHALHETPEHIPEEIRPKVPGYQELTKVLGRELTSEKGRPDIPMGVAFMPNLGRNKALNQIERDYAEGKHSEGEAREKLAGLGEEPDKYHFIEGHGMITPHEERPDIITPEEHNQLKTTLRQQWLAGKLTTNSYKERVAELPLPEKPSEPGGVAYMPMAGPKATGYQAAKEAGQTFRSPLEPEGSQRKPRFEISDRDMEFQQDTTGNYRTRLERQFHNDPYRNGGKMKLSDVIDHPELFKNYPHLRNTTVRMDPEMYADGVYEHPYRDPLAPEGKDYGDQITLKGPDKETIAHEIQHAVQYFENFAGKGASSKAIYNRLKQSPGVMAEIDKAATERDLDDPDKWKDYRLRQMAHAMYEHDPGEMEARTVGRRAMGETGFTPAEDIGFERELAQQRYPEGAPGTAPGGVAYMRGKAEAAQEKLTKPKNWDDQPEDVRQAYLEKKVARTLTNQYRGPETHELEVDRNDAGGVKYDPQGNPIYKKRDYDIANSPLLKKKGLSQIQGADEHEDTIDENQHTHLNQVERRRLSAMRAKSAVSTMGDKIVESYLGIKDIPEIAAGKGWYSRMRQKLADALGEHHELFAQLLGATSAKTPVRNNFIQSLDALEQFKNGDFDKHKAKYLEAYQKLREGGKDALVAHMKELGIPLKNDDGETVQDHKTDAAAMENWIAHHEILPKQKNGQKYNANSLAVLRALAGTWLDETDAPKTPNFAGNLTGRTLEATIDVWAARHLQRLGYEGQTKGKPWRAQAGAEPGVNALDFAFSQDAMRHAADKLSAMGHPMNPDDLQAILWFAEKQHYENKSWTRGAGAEKSSFDDVADLAFPKTGKPMTSEDLRTHYANEAAEKQWLKDRIETAKGYLESNDPKKRAKLDPYLEKHATRKDKEGNVLGPGLTRGHLTAAPSEEEEEEEAA